MRDASYHSDPYVKSLWSISDLSAHLGRSPKTMHRWRERGYMPQPDLKLPGGALRWKDATIERWLQSLEIGKES